MSCSVEPIVLASRREEDTERLGRIVGETVHGGARLALGGELGAGKTCFVRGLAGGLGVPPALVRSPSFPIILPYPGGRLPLYHIDLYRQDGADDREELRELLYGDGVCAVEWYERLAEPLVDYLAIDLTLVGSTRRSIVAAAHGVGYDRVLEALRGLQ